MFSKSVMVMVGICLNMKAIERKKEKNKLLVMLLPEEKSEKIILSKS